uniref:Uncharacterized protein n=1 Tax=Bionectria ochroleuca TaxID=29856 RepID=A0A8H7N206_BIOOC
MHCGPSPEAIRAHPLSKGPQAIKTISSRNLVAINIGIIIILTGILTIIIGISLSIHDITFHKAATLLAAEHWQPSTAISQQEWHKKIYHHYEHLCRGHGIHHCRYH